MKTKESLALVDSILMRAAETIGDITQPVMTQFYQQFPQAQELFKHHASNDIHRLEGEMVEQALFCLMYWLESPGEIEILLNGSVPHHHDTLGVPTEYYQGLLAATATIVLDSIPESNSEERKLWLSLKDQLTDIVQQSSRYNFKNTA